MTEGITAVLLFAIAVFAFWMSVRSFMEKGFLWNNAYIYASRQEREKMNKKPHYRQSAIVFLLIGLAFLCNAFAVLLDAYWMFAIVAVLVIITLIYAIGSSIAIEKNKNR